MSTYERSDNGTDEEMGIATALDTGTAASSANPGHAEALPRCTCTGCPDEYCGVNFSRTNPCGYVIAKKPQYLKEVKSCRRCACQTCQQLVIKCSCPPASRRREPEPPSPREPGIGQQGTADERPPPPPPVPRSNDLAEPHDNDDGRQTTYGTCPPWLEWKEDPEFGKDLYLRCKLCAKWVCDKYDTRSPTTYDGIHGKTSEKNSKEHKRKLNAASSSG